MPRTKSKAVATSKNNINIKINLAKRARPKKVAQAQQSFQTHFFHPPPVRILHEYMPQHQPPQPSFPAPPPHQGSGLPPGPSGLSVGTASQTETHGVRHGSAQTETHIRHGASQTTLETHRRGTQTDGEPISILRPPPPFLPPSAPIRLDVPRPLLTPLVSRRLEPTVSPPLSFFSSSAPAPPPLAAGVIPAAFQSGVNSSQYDQSRSRSRSPEASSPFPAPPPPLAPMLALPAPPLPPVVFSAGAAQPVRRSRRIQRNTGPHRSEEHVIDTDEIQRKRDRAYNRKENERLTIAHRGK